VAAAELGLWGTMGTLLMSFGLENTTALRASLLLGVINILVPFLTSLSGEPVGRLTWVAAGKCPHTPLPSPLSCRANHSRLVK
jgi:drug/metabolite transporter (DMT)-like permease